MTPNNSFRNDILRMMLCLILWMILTACSSAQATPTMPPTATLPPTQTPVPPTATPTPIPTLLSGPLPSSRGYSKMVFDTESQQIVLFGGFFNDGKIYGSDRMDTWAFNPATNEWRELKPASSPPTGSPASMVYHAKADRVILYYGAIGAPDGWYPAGGTWAYDTNTNSWTDLNARNTPSGRFGQAMAYDSESDKVILFGGVNLPRQTYLVELNKIMGETWAYDYATNTWTEMKPTVSPEGLVWRSDTMVYDSKSDRILLWAPNEKQLTDIWAYDYNTNTWEKHTYSLDPGVGQDSNMVYDPDTGLVYTYVNTTLWAYDYSSNKWAPFFVGNPGTFYAYSLVYDPINQRMLMFGGTTDYGRYFNSMRSYKPDPGSLGAWTYLGP